MSSELTAGELKKLLAAVPDDATILYEGDVDNRWGQYVTTHVRIENGSVVIS